MQPLGASPSAGIEFCCDRTQGCCEAVSTTSEYGNSHTEWSERRGDCETHFEGLTDRQVIGRPVHTAVREALLFEPPWALFLERQRLKCKLHGGNTNPHFFYKAG